VGRRRVAITGYGMVTPLGGDAAATFERAARGESGIDFISAFETAGLPCRIGGEVDARWLGGPQDPGARQLVKFSSRGARLMQVATKEAAAAAALETLPDRDRIGVALGSHGENPAVDDIRHLHRFYDDRRGWDVAGLTAAGGYPFLNFLRRKPDVASALIAVQFDCRGPNLSFASACAAGAQAIGEASRLIRDGAADVMLAGGCEAPLSFFGFIGFLLLKALVEKYPTPQRASRPFDRRRNGFVMSEGAGCVVLEELEHARARGASIHAELCGYGDSADAYRITDTHPQGAGALLAMQGALADAGLGAGAVDYINAHGTSTVQNDLTETRAIKALLGERSRSVPVSSNKSMLGHTIAAAGAIECILTVMGLERSLLLPTINSEAPDPKCDLDYVPNAARRQQQRHALSNSFGFGGQNACLCVGRLEG
jgi:3-oxoacyl-[acyl-carrier-protein] synthase II